MLLTPHDDDCGSPRSRHAILRSAQYRYITGWWQSACHSASLHAVTRTHVAVVVAASLAGLLFGFDTAVIAGVTHSLRLEYALSPAGLGATVSSALWGTLVGALVMGAPGDKFGSRDTLRFIGALYAVAAVGCAFAWSLPSFVVFRFLVGLAVGGSSVLAPVYISEIAPPERRGALVGLFQFNIVLGILLAYCSNFVVAQLVSGPQAWRVKLAVAAFPAMVFFILLLTVPNSPRWLALKGRVAEAIASLRRLGVPDPEAVIAGFGPAREEGAAADSLSWRRYRKPILLAVTLAMFNQLSGINAILYYLGDIFAAAGFSSLSADLQSVAIGATNLVATVIGMSVIDKLGRKALLLIGSVGTAIALAGVAVIMGTGSNRSLLLPLLIGFIASFALSQGAVIWVYLSEVFPTPVRSRGQSLGSATHWVMNALVSSLFPTVAAYSTAMPFAFFAAMMALQFGVVLVAFPETKGISLERMAERMSGGKSRIS
jgi:sugar porter (SP) family MFS transporter